MAIHADSWADQRPPEHRDSPVFVLLMGISGRLISFEDVTGRAHVTAETRPGVVRFDATAETLLGPEDCESLGHWLLAAAKKLRREATP